MESVEFLNRVKKIEDHLYYLMPSYDRHQGFLGLLKELEKKSILSKREIHTIYQIWDGRNRLINSREFTHDRDMAEILSRAEKSLSLV